MTKKITPHHTITPKGGRVASRKRERPTSRAMTARPRPCAFPFFIEFRGRIFVTVTGREKVMSTRKRGS